MFTIMNHAFGLVGKFQQSSCDQIEIEYMVRRSHILHVQNVIMENTGELQIVASYIGWGIILVHLHISLVI